MAKNFTVLVEGNISARKTTLLDFFQQNFDGDVTVFREPVDKWCDVEGFNLLVSKFSFSN